MKKLLSMKKLIFIATMFLISVSANSQIIDVEEKGSWLEVTNAKGEKIDVTNQNWPLVGWTKSYILLKRSDNCQVQVINSKGESINTLYFASSGVENDCPPNLRINVTPNYFSIGIKIGGSGGYEEITKYDNKGERIK